ncbi:hypothetical protein SAMN05660662_3894 [Blastococcus aurantiacus]|uniref:Uncharacterized protein n=1 Tax=Blastococcus aurantiacus TaxID=1550231 RepID=A0A1G7Q8S7_9ACTN|nr:hypothetical protein [Blastococcus aurantiacus]SDF94893.1 hypothetical protein SAMN05660662_3894 [Blastococcus aurantiacus]
MWSHAFGNGDPDLERRMNRPENEVPAALPMNRLLVRTPDVAVALLGLQVYTTGVAFQLAARARGPEDPAAPDRLGDLFWNHRGGSPRFLLGVQFADGRRASNVPVRGADGDLVFHPGGGSGGSVSVDQDWWLSPLPPEGPLLVVVRCPEIGLEETGTELDGTAIRRAGESATVLWPYEPPLEQPHEPPPPPDLPAGSWFAG